jgi:hypothetical protein
MKVLVYSIDVNLDGLHYEDPEWRRTKHMPHLDVNYPCEEDYAQARVLPRIKAQKAMWGGVLTGFRNEMEQTYPVPHKLSQAECIKRLPDLDATDDWYSYHVFYTSSTEDYESAPRIIECETLSDNVVPKSWYRQHPNAILADPTFKELFDTAEHQAQVEDWNAAVQEFHNKFDTEMYQEKLRRRNWYVMRNCHCDDEDVNSSLEEWILISKAFKEKWLPRLTALAK